MNAPLDLKLDPATFLQWVQGREGRYELERGRVVQQMTGGSRNHSIIAGRFVKALTIAMDDAVWNILSGDLAVTLGNTTRFPDVLVERAGGDGKALETSEPVLLVEVLSPSSVARDLNVKVAEYLSLPSLEAYIVASQDEPIVWIWQRSTEGARDFPKQPVEINGRDQAIALSFFGFGIAMEPLYRGIGTAPQS